MILNIYIHISVMVACFIAGVKAGKKLKKAGTWLSILACSIIWPVTAIVVSVMVAKGIRGKNKLEKA